MNMIINLPVQSESPKDIVSSEQYELQLSNCAQKIENGLNTTEAGTGYPINKLHGGAHINAVMAAIGGGPINKGGSGMAGGLQVLLQYKEAVTALKVQQESINPTLLE